MDVYMYSYNYDAKTSTWLVAIHNLPETYTGNINLEAVNCIIERELTTNWYYFIRIYWKK